MKSRDSAERDDARADEAAIALAARDDLQAFLPLYERYATAIHRYCLVRFGDQDRAADATGEVFIRAIDGLGGFRGGSFRAWLFTIAKHVVASTYRAPRTETLELVAARHDDSPSPEALVLRGSQQEVLRDALLRLTDDQRSVIELQLAGWNGREIAEALGKSPAAIKMLRMRALRQLREELAGWDAEVAQ